MIGLTMLVLILFMSSCQFASTTYFTMSDIQLTIVTDRAKLPKANHPITVLYAQSDNIRDYKNDFLKYYVNSTCSYLQVAESTGALFFKSSFLQSDIKGLDKISCELRAEDSVRDISKTTIKINIFPLDRLDCDEIVNDLCFWNNVKYSIQELSKATVLGPLSSQYVLDMCPEYKINYTLVQGSDDFSLVSPSSHKSWSIRSTKALDRDLQGDKISVTIKCMVENKQGTIREIDRNITVDVLDVDNHPPVPQYTEFKINMPNTHVNEKEVIKHQHLIFRDKDSPAVNNYKANFLVDGRKTNLLQANCTKYPDTRTKMTETAVHCSLIFKEHKHFEHPSYNVIMELNDTTLKNANHLQAGLVHVPIYFIFNNSSRLIKEKPLILYPDKVVKVFRTAGPLARITQPKSFQGCSKFSMSEDPNKNIFNITFEGIVFVHDAAQLRNASEFVRLNISWTKDKKRNYDIIQVRIVDEPTVTCNHIGPHLNNWTFCSKYKTASDCLKKTACAISTGGSSSVTNRRGPERCMWRGDLNPGANFTHLYSTCTPDINTCPDGICDSLEQLSDLICPQDCTVKVHFPISKNLLTGKGIDYASGVCSCDEFGFCLCEMPSKKNNKKKNKLSTTTSTTPQPNVSRHTSNETARIFGVEIAKCGTSCVLGIVAGALFLGGAVALVVICWRLDRVNKAVRGKYNDESQDLGATLSDYIDRNVPPDTLALNFQMTTSLTETATLNIVNKLAPDPKWEFPRSHLTIEQTLGEGEFGRVLRAKALDISGQSGYTTVAVKTLKEDARETELNDLLSEYQLLKEVSHPNVIRLLGVCTAPGGPIYLIIEFAEHGSLRNYLRRSRHLKSESKRLPSSSGIEENNEIHYDEPNVSKVTPKEILSFAWQISNGMAYLSDIKLVHRDLAARNVLIAADKICKISDFGLTRDIYEDNAYFKRSKGRVPVKWMAPESLSDHIYTSKSDVWSFGILLWELVTLGATPYPGIAVQNLFHLIRQGYRMERPDNCSPALYKLMRSCWHLDPEQRPSFHDLTMCWEKMLGDGIEYLDLTNNAIHNRSYFCSPFEDNEEIPLMEKSDTNPLNYLSKSQSYIKCGATDKILNEESENNLAETDSNQNINTQGYETPVKFPKKVQTPPNECPQEYTDMEAAKPK